MPARFPWLVALMILAVVPHGAQAARNGPARSASSGAGEVAAEPDMAYVTLGIEARRPTLAEARTEVSAR